MSLYTISTPYENELGDWKNFNELQTNPNHKDFMNSISQLKPLDKDDAYKRAAIENIKSYPRKYLFNWIANVGRLLFSYPYSNSEQTLKSYFTIIPNMFVVVFIVLALIIGTFNYKRMNQELIILLLFILIYLFCSSLISAFRRMFYITMPFWFLYIAFVFNNIISIKIRQA